MCGTKPVVFTSSGAEYFSCCLFLLFRRSRWRRCACTRAVWRKLTLRSSLTVSAGLMVCELCPGKRTHRIMALDMFVLINAATKRLVSPYQGIVSWKGLYCSIPISSGVTGLQEQTLESGIVTFSLLQWGTGTGLGWVKLRISWTSKDIAIFYYWGWDKLRMQIFLPFLWWSHVLCVTLCHP